MDEGLLRLHDADEVWLARRNLPAGAEVRGLTLREAIPRGHKVAAVDIPAGQPVHKYGQVIGFASSAIEAGSWVHLHNLSFGTGELGLDYAVGSAARPLPPAGEPATFRGYRRSDGRVGTRNYIAVISTVNCSAAVVQGIARRFEGRERDYPDFDGVIPIAHLGGCGGKPGWELQLLQRTLAGFAKHPNVGAYVVVGLGCEGNCVADLMAYGDLTRLEAAPGVAPPVIVMQEVGGTQAAIEAGVAAVEALLPKVAEARREEVSAEYLTLALQCGGSDSLSGITANPAVGVAADWLVRHGGTAVLAETPEIYGAEHLLTRRAVSQEVADRLLARIAWWKEYTTSHGFSIDNNPAPGNKAGGLTTIFEKSLGAVAKAGSAPLTAVYEYAERITHRGLVHMDTPGYDPVGATGQVAGGCNLIVFTTGRGSCFGFKPSPVLKIATNTPMYETMRPDMDINAGTIFDGTESVADVGRRIFDRLLSLASGEASLSEAQGLGSAEFNPWILGCTM